MIYKYSDFFEIEIDILDKEQMSLHSIRLPKKMVNELMVSFEQYGPELSNIIRRILQEALDTNAFEKTQGLLTQIMHNAMMEKSREELTELKAVKVEIEFLKIGIMECFAHLIHATETEKIELEKMIMRDAKERVYRL